MYLVFSLALVIFKDDGPIVLKHCHLLQIFCISSQFIFQALPQRVWCTKDPQGHFFPSVLTMEISYEFVRIRGKKSWKWFLRIRTKFPIISQEELKLASWKFLREVIQTHRGAQLFLSFSICKKQKHPKKSSYTVYLSFFKWFHLLPGVLHVWK